MYVFYFKSFQKKIKRIAEHFGIPYIAKEGNIGIGQAFIELTEQAKTDNVLVLEHDWKLIEDKETLRTRLLSGVKLLDNGFSCVRYRHRANPGFPHFSFQYHLEES